MRIHFIHRKQTLLACTVATVSLAVAYFIMDTPKQTAVGSRVQGSGGAEAGGRAPTRDCATSLTFRLPPSDFQLSSTPHSALRTPHSPPIRLCQAFGPPPVPECVYGTDCGPGGCNDDLTWKKAQPVPWNTFGPGEYVAHPRTPHVPEYRLRVDDQLELVYRLTRDESAEPYELNVGDEIRIESLTGPDINRESLIIQPDGTITLRLLGQVRATGRTVEELRGQLEETYSKYYKMPTITVTPLKVNTKLEDLRATVDSRAGTGGQSRTARVTPEGTIALPAIGSVPVFGLTLEEAAREINERYRAEVEGIEVTPVLEVRAPRYVYVLGEVGLPGRYPLEGPTTVMQAIAMAGSWNVGAGLKQVVIFRRGDDWRLMATKLDLQNTLWGKKPCPADEIWLNDSDIVLVPKSPILLADDFINLVFTRGVYGVMPFVTSYSFNNFTAL